MGNTPISCPVYRLCFVSDPDAQHAVLRALGPALDSGFAGWHFLCVAEEFRGMVLGGATLAEACMVECLSKTAQDTASC